MARLLIGFFSLFICQITLGQIKYGYVDMDKLVKNHPLKLHYDSVYQTFEKSLTDSLNSYMVEFNKKIEDGYPGRTNDKKREKEIEALQIRIQNFNKDSERKLTYLKNQHLIFIKEQIVKAINEYNKNGDFELIFDKQSILTSKSGIDLTEVILQRLKK